MASMTSEDSPVQKRGVSRVVLAIVSALATLVAGVLIPGAGLVVALVLAFTVLRQEGQVRWWVLGLGVLLALLSSYLLFAESV